MNRTVHIFWTTDPIWTLGHPRRDANNRLALHDTRGTTAPQAPATDLTLLSVSAVRFRLPARVSRTARTAVTAHATSGRRAARGALSLALNLSNPGASFVRLP